MKAWPKHPAIYEINTWVWLAELSREHQRPVNLATVPEQEWDAIASYGFDAVWFMGVWERSPAGIEVSMRNKGLLEDFRRALADFSAEDNVGSPYCVRRYVVDQRLGGPAGLAAAREMLAKRGLRLILDFVPNHVAPDHPGRPRIPSISFRETTRTCAKTQPPSLLPRDGFCLWPGPVLSSLARCAPAQRLQSGAAGPSLKRYNRSPSSAMACGATWPC